MQTAYSYSNLALLLFTVGSRSNANLKGFTVGSRPNANLQGFTVINLVRLDVIFFSAFGIVAGHFVVVDAALSSLAAHPAGDPIDRPPESFRRRLRSSVPEDSFPGCPARPSEDYPGARTAGETSPDGRSASASFPARRSWSRFECCRCCRLWKQHCSAGAFSGDVISMVLSQ